MSTSRPVGLRIGDQVRFEDRLHSVVGLEGTLVRLADEGGSVAVIHLPHLLMSAGFERVDRADRLPLPQTSRLQGLSPEEMRVAEWWETHLHEVLTGLPPQAGPDTAPRPEYDPAVHSLAARERAKAAELAGLGIEGASERTLRRKRKHYQEQGHGLWEVHHDPYDVSRIWVRRREAGWITVPWRHLSTVPGPFGELAWDHARRELPDGSEEERAQAVAELLDRAHQGPVPTGSEARRRKRVAARTRAAARTAVPPPPKESQPESPDETDASEGEAVAKVIPLGLFDPLEDPWRKR
ncbi:hypothetical protein [Streptomyces mirabilis]|uniref:hypothetical protein n=1 Tax=Streptomyces mirabilis TaxID=68239 RepID=UPI0036DBB5C3